MAKEKKYKVVIELDSARLKKDLAEAQKNVGNFTNKTTSGLKNLKGVMPGIGTAAKASAAIAAAAFAGFTAIVLKAVDAANKYENALIGLKSVAGSTGQNIDKMTKAAEELSKDGMIPLEDVSRALKSLLASGLDGDKAIEVFKALRNSAAFNRQGQLSLAQAVVGAADGIKNQNSIMVDNAGITKNLSIILKEYAGSVGKSVASLSEQEKRIAIGNGIIKEATIFQGDYNKLLATFQAQTNKASNGINIMFRELGLIITQNPEVLRTMKDLNEGIASLIKLIKDNKDEISNFFGELAKIARLDFKNLKVFKESDLRTNISLITQEVKIFEEALQEAEENAKKKGFLSRILYGDKEARDKDIREVEAKLADAKKRLSTAKADLNALLNPDSPEAPEENKGGTKTTKTGNKGGKVENAAQVKRREAILLKIKELQDLELLAEEEHTLKLREAQDIATDEDLERLREIEQEKSFIKQTWREEEALLIEDERLRAAALEQIALEGSLERQKIASQQGLKIAKDEAKERADIKKKMDKQLETQQKKTGDLQVTLFKETGRAIAQLAGANQQEAFLLEKAFAVADVFIQDAKARAAATAAAASAAASAGPAAPGVFAGVLAGLQATISTNTGLSLGIIAAQTVGGLASFQTGGVIADGSNTGDRTLIRANRKERVLTPEQNDSFERAVDLASAGGFGGANAEILLGIRQDLQDFGRVYIDGEEITDNINRRNDRRLA